ncbi:hypothetical protein ACFL0U_04505, partial [Pseudomonadota bacterium]
MKLKLLLLTLLFCCLLTNDAHASSMNLLFDVSNNVIGAVERFTIQLYGAVALAYRKVYFLLCLIILPMVVYSYVKNKISEDTVIAFLLAIFLSATIVLNKDNFVAFIYEPFFDTLYSFASYIADTSSGNYYSGATGVETMFANMYASSNAFIEILDRVRDDISIFNMLKSLALMLTIFIIKFLFIFLV